MCAVLVLGVAQADQSTDATGDYAKDLTRVIAAIRAISALKDVCAEGFTHLRQQNEAAHAEWRRRHQEFLDEMERHLSEMTWGEAKGEDARHLELLAKYDEQFAQDKAGLRNGLMVNGPESFRRVCSVYPRYILETERGNLQHFYEGQVRVIRKGPPAAAGAPQ